MITIYGTPQCGFCKLAIELAQKHRLDFKFKNVERNAFYDELKTKDVNMDIIPHIWWDDEYIGTYPDFLTKCYSLYQ